MSTYNEVICTARASWLSNYTLGDKRWRLKQLHGLHEMVLNNRDVLVSALAAEQSVASVLYEKEVAIFIKELHSHISKLHKESRSKPISSLHLRKFSIAERPCGVSLIVTAVPNMIRYGLAPLAASIAANNVVILATTSAQSNPFISCLQREWNKYLDTDSLFLFPGSKPTDIQIDGIDHISIFDKSQFDYAEVLKSPKAHFHSVSSGYSIAIVGEGDKNWKAIAREVLENSTGHRLSSDRLSAVFLRTEDSQKFHNALSSVNQGKQCYDKGSAHEVVHEMRQQGCTLWDTDIFHLDQSSLKKPETKPTLGLENCLRLTTASGSLLVVAVTSIDEALDLINGLSDSLQQLAILAPGSNKNTEYIRSWTNAYIFSVGSICDVSPPIFDSFIALESFQNIFPSTIFSRPQVITEQALGKAPMLTPAIRAMYRKTIPPLKPEGRGERIGFFTQVEYLLKGVGVIVGVLAASGIYCGFKALQKRP